MSQRSASLPPRRWAGLHALGCRCRWRRRPPPNERGQHAPRTISRSLRLRAGMTLVAEVALWAGAPAATRPVELEQLIHAHFRFIWRLLRRLGLPESDADDAAQQVFLIAHGKLQRIAP